MLRNLKVLRKAISHLGCPDIICPSPCIQEFINGALSTATFSLVLLVSISGCISAQAQLPCQGTGFCVNTTTDSPDTNPGDGDCATGLGQCSIRAAIEEATALGGSQRIVLSSQPFPYRIAEQLEVKSGSITIEGHTIPSMPIIEPTSNSKGKHRILYVPQAVSVTLRNVIVRRGYPPKSHDGGGIFNEGTLLLDGCIIAENSTDDKSSGGGIFNTGTLTLTSSVVRDNGFPVVSSQSFTRMGGGIHHKNGVLKIQDSEIVGNRAEES